MTKQAFILMLRSTQPLRAAKGPSSVGMRVSTFFCFHARRCTVVSPAPDHRIAEFMIPFMTKVLDVKTQPNDLTPDLTSNFEPDYDSDLGTVAHPAPDLGTVANPAPDPGTVANSTPGPGTVANLTPGPEVDTDRTPDAAFDAHARRSTLAERAAGSRITFTRSSRPLTALRSTPARARPKNNKSNPSINPATATRDSRPAAPAPFRKRPPLFTQMRGRLALTSLPGRCMRTSRFTPLFANDLFDGIVDYAIACKKVPLNFPRWRSRRRAVLLQQPSCACTRGFASVNRNSISFISHHFPPTTDLTLNADPDPGTGSASEFNSNPDHALSSDLGSGLPLALAILVAGRSVYYNEHEIEPSGTGQLGRRRARMRLSPRRLHPNIQIKAWRLYKHVSEMS
ncbi:hypothetical protein EVAR_99798_1 [Eumeta japonica]|uniref:Uncharacterized protein n=1 Tax=Eumeta variegata TaxID=151549 RepID=A0A4C1ZAS9_EUMVA|nr:hypothetical protein EVAR_99798_1 [Eumeta japonica]